MLVVPLGYLVFIKTISGETYRIRDLLSHQRFSKGALNEIFNTLEQTEK